MPSSGPKPAPLHPPRRTPPPRARALPALRTLPALPPAGPGAIPPLPRRLPMLLRRAWYGLNQSFRRRIAHLDLTPDQYTVLRSLTEAGADGLTQTGLTGHMASDPNTIASLVERMEKSGLLRRETDPADRRARRLRLAPTGRRRFAAAWKVATQLQEEILGGIPESERGPFLEVLEKVAIACSAAADRDGSGVRPPHVQPCPSAT